MKSDAICFWRGVLFVSSFKVDEKGRVVTVRKTDAPMVKVVVYPEHIVVLSCTKDTYRYIGLLEMQDVSFTTDLAGMPLTAKQAKLHRDTGWVLRARLEAPPSTGATSCPPPVPYVLACSAPEERHRFLLSLQKLAMRSAERLRQRRTSSVSAFFHV